MVDNNTKTGISPSTLGRERKRYFEMGELAGVTKKQVIAQMKLDAKRYAKKMSKDISFDDYKTDIETLPQRGGNGKREADKLERDALIVETQELNAVTNLAIQSQRGEVTLSDGDKVKAFDIIGQRGDTLAEHLHTAFDKVGALTMVHAPDSLLCVHIAGWEDGSKNLRFQYSPRKVPITKRSGYRDDSMVAPVHQIPEPKPKRNPKPVVDGSDQLDTTPPETPPETPELLPVIDGSDS